MIGTMKIHKRVVIITILIALLAGTLFFCSRRSVSEPENIPPTCTITQPVHGSQFALGDVIDIRANADDEDGRVASVRFFIDNRLIHEDFTRPFIFLWDTSGESAGTHMIRAEARDDDHEGGLSPALAATLSLSIIPANLDSVMAATLTERIISDNFIFHFTPGDTVYVERSEAFHAWAVDYLDITPWKKIDYYKFRTRAAVNQATGGIAGARAFSYDCALAASTPWHNHECMHIYNRLFSSATSTRFYSEGMCVAHEVDPYNNDFVPQANRTESAEPYIYPKEIRRFLADGALVPLEDILESDAFHREWLQRGFLIYLEAGMFVKYLVETFGLEKMKEAYCSVVYADSKAAIMARFQETFGTTIQEAEADWLAYLEATPWIE